MHTKSDCLKITLAGPRGGTILVQTRCKECNQLYKGMGACPDCTTPHIPIRSENNLTRLIFYTKIIIALAFLAIMYDRTQCHPIASWISVSFTIVLLYCWWILTDWGKSIPRLIMQSITPTIGILIIIECVIEIVSQIR